MRRWGLRVASIEAIETETVYSTIKEFWQPFNLDTGPAPDYYMSLDDDQRNELQEFLARNIGSRRTCKPQSKGLGGPTDYWRSVSAKSYEFEHFRRMLVIKDKTDWILPETCLLINRARPERLIATLFGQLKEVLWERNQEWPDSIFAIWL